MQEALSRPINRSTLLLLALLSATALAGCGKSDSETPGDTVVAYLDAFAAGDGDEACERLTEETKRVLVPRVGRKVGARDCPGAVATLRNRLTVPQADAFSRASATRVRVDGDTAVVRFRADTLRGGAELRKVSGEWKISLLPRSR
ncbi:MAG: hypothetical protein ACR2GL_05165 [Thermoleophilaceae bacterium]